MVWLLQAVLQASSMAVSEIPLLHILAKALICFMPYWVSDPQRVSNTTTCRPNFEKLENNQESKGGNNRQCELRTIDFKHSQSSTTGKPRGLTALRRGGPFSGPSRSIPISSILWSKWTLCCIVCVSCLRISFFSESAFDLLYCSTGK